MSTDFFTSLVEIAYSPPENKILLPIQSHSCFLLTFFMAQSFGMKIEKIEMFD